MSQPLPPFTKVKTRREYTDGTAEIESLSKAQRKLSSVKQEISQTIKTTRESLAAELINCLQHISYHETEELTLNIKIKENGDPLITKTWTVRKEYYGQ